jgi:hypothetical protein
MNRRTTIPKATREQVLAEFNHRCAVCGAERPQVHHIDENPANNDPLNLLPLCPNCHLTDHHNPTRPIDPLKLTLFRKYKDPAILKPQFEPLFSRTRFLFDLSEPVGYDALKSRTSELRDFVSVLEMGAFYSSRLHQLIGPPPGRGFVDLYEPDEVTQHWWREHEREYREQLVTNREAVLALVVELLRYQRW